MNPPTIVLLGSTGVGKTSLVKQICFKSFSKHYQPTVEDMYGHLVMSADGAHHYIYILDTAGSFEFPAQVEVNIRNGQAFMIVYAIDKQDSFTKAVDLLELVRKIKANHETPIIMVGNKQDEEKHRVISKNTGNKLAERHGCFHVETSAKQYSCVKDTLDPLISKMYLINIEKSSNLVEEVVTSCISR